MAFSQKRTRAAISSAREKLNDSIEMHSPPVCSIQPRKLEFGSPREKSDEEAYIIRKNNKQESSVSPPYRKVRALRLFDTPATPKTILQKSSGKCVNYLSAAAEADKLRRESLPVVPQRPLSLPLHNRTLDIVLQEAANINPFTPDSLQAHNKKRCRTQFGRENIGNNSVISFLNNEDDFNDGDHKAEAQQAPKRLALQDTNISRYRKEFVEISLIGVGEFGLVYQCLNRLDGCIYAIKRSIKPVAGSSFEKRALNEVWAHAVLGKHDNVVRYYSAWAEDNHMLIQNEYCNGGSLQSFIQKRSLTESELKILLLHVADGLRYIHSNDLVHMDLKAGNIFLTKVPSTNKSTLPPLTKECYENGMDGIYEELNNTDCIITYKIGDLGHVTSVKEAYVEEGDSRYLPNEILHEDFSDLCKADIFSLGITLYEAAGGGPLPKNGPMWHNLREGKVPTLPSLSKEFNDLIKLMTHPDPEVRPSSTTIFNHPILNSLESKTKLQLSQELAIEKSKNEILLRKLREAKKTIKALEQNTRISANNPQNSKSPHIYSEQRCLRSYTKKRRIPCVTNKMDGLRDRNKTVFSNYKY